MVIHQLHKRKKKKKKASIQNKQNAKERHCPWTRQIMPPIISRFYLRNKPWKLRNLSSAFVRGLLCTSIKVARKKFTGKICSSYRMDSSQLLRTQSEVERENKSFFFFGKVRVNVHCIVSLHTEQTILLCTNIKILFSASLENPLQAEPLWEHLKQLLLKTLSPPITYSQCVVTFKSSSLLLFSIEV